MGLKERLAQKRTLGATSTPAAGTTSRLGALRSKVGGSIQQSKLQTQNTDSIRNKFQKRSQTVLDKTYEDRNERSKGGMTGKTIFNQELMAEYGIEDFKSTLGDRFMEVLPISFRPEIPYYDEISVHFSVGFSKDAFICMHRKSNQRCYRCEKQQVMWRDQVTYTKDQAVALFPTDRACYLLWERTKELVEGESPDYIFKLWAAPKQKVHSEIQEKVRNKINRTTLDISDVSVDGEGRTVGFTIVKQGDYPDYKAFDLIARDQPIPDEVIIKLEQIISAAEEQGYSNCLEMFYNIPTYDEIKESMDTEEELIAQQTPQASTGVGSRLRPTLQQQATPAITQQDPIAVAEAELQNELAEIQKEMESVANNPLRWRKWCNDNGYADALEMDVAEAIPAIIDDLYDKGMADITGESH